MTPEQLSSAIVSALGRMAADGVIGRGEVGVHVEMRTGEDDINAFWRGSAKL